ncbi:MAG TPA: hypothetical protein VF765_31560 [Polyangiaceae bacterium]
MKKRVLAALWAAAMAGACGGSSSTLSAGNDGGGGGSDSGSGSSSGGSGSSSGTGSSSGASSGSSSGGSGSSSGGTDASTTCGAGKKSCGGMCVDTGNDPQNCGGCGIVCNTTCANGVCQLVSADAGTPPVVGDNACLTVDAKSVYWGTGQANGSVWSVPVAGGVPVQVVGGQAAPHAMASDGTTLYFGDQGAGNCTGSVEAVPVGGGTATPIAMGQCTPLDVVADATSVYWTNTGDGSVWKSDKSNPNPVNLVPAAGQGHAGYLRVDAVNVYFTDQVGGVINRVPIAGGAVTAVSTSGIPGPGHLAIDSSTAYFGSHSNTGAAMLTVPLAASGGTANQLVVNLPAINGIETDGMHVWFAEATDVQPYKASTGEIHRVTVAGKNDTILASMQNGPNCIAVDATSIYWINTGGGTISKTGK